MGPKKRSLAGLLSTVLALGLLLVAPTPASADTGAAASCAGAGDATAITLCQIKYNASYAAWMALPDHADREGSDSTADQQAWSAATTPDGYAAYVAGWKLGIDYVDGAINGDQAFSHAGLSLRADPRRSSIVLRDPSLVAVGGYECPSDGGVECAGGE